jgi:hypothetical protein
VKLRPALLFLAYIASLLLGGCRRPPADFVPMYVEDGHQATVRKLPMRWSFDCDFPREKRTYVRAGFDYWNGLLDRTFFVEDKCDTWDGQSAGLRISRSAVRHPKDCDAFSILAVTQREIGKRGLSAAQIIYYPVWFQCGDENELVATSRHELGHVLGFNHFPWKECLMYHNVVDGSVGEPKRMCFEEILTFLRFYDER